MKKEEIIEILIENYGKKREDLKKMKKDELKEMLENYQDTSLFHPNESYDEFMEHENME